MKHTKALNPKPQTHEPKQASIQLHSRVCRVTMGQMQPTARARKTYLGVLRV